MKRLVYIAIALIVGIGSYYLVNNSNSHVGFGKNATGGTGGAIYIVSTCEELFSVINKDEPRIIKWSKNFNCDKLLEITKGNLTIDAPIGSYEGRGVVITAKNVIVKGLTIAVGDNGYSEDGRDHPDDDALLLASGAEDIYIDDVLLMWSIDENIGIYGDVRNVTIINSRIVEALNDSHHKDGSHSMGLLINEGAQNISILNNTFMHNIERNIRQSNGCSSEVRGNIFFGMRRTSEISPGNGFTFEDNHYIKGLKQEVLSSALVNDVGSGVRVYAEGNTSDYDANEIEGTITKLSEREIYSGGRVKTGLNLLEDIKTRVNNKDYKNKRKYLLDEALLQRKGKIIDTQLESVLNN